MDSNIGEKCILVGIGSPREHRRAQVVYLDLLEYHMFGSRRALWHAERDTARVSAVRNERGDANRFNPKPILTREVDLLLPIEGESRVGEDETRPTRAVVDRLDDDLGVARSRERAEIPPMESWRPSVFRAFEVCIHVLSPPLETLDTRRVAVRVHSSRSPSW